MYAVQKYNYLTGNPWAIFIRVFSKCYSNHTNNCNKHITEAAINQIYKNKRTSLVWNMSSPMCYSNFLKRIHLKQEKNCLWLFTWKPLETAARKKPHIIVGGINWTYTYWSIRIWFQMVNHLSYYWPKTFFLSDWEYPSLLIEHQPLEITWWSAWTPVHFKTLHNHHISKAHGKTHLVYKY